MFGLFGITFFRNSWIDDSDPGWPRPEERGWADRMLPRPFGPDFSLGMVIHMKTTLNIDDSVMQRLREEAPRRGTTMSALVEAGLRLVLAEPATTDEQAENLPPLPSWNSGGHLVDSSNRDELYRVMEEE